MTKLDFYFDPLCPWAYEASRWIHEVQRQRDLDVSWRFFSLEEANWRDGTKHPWERPWSFGWSLLRVAALLRRWHGNEAVAEFYATAGRMLHDEGVAVLDQAGAEAVLRRMGEDPQLVAEAISDASTTADVLAEHRGAVERGVYGVPTLVIDDHSLFGPVITPAPTGDQAVELWELVLAWTQFPHLYELQRVKGPRDHDHITGRFAPYRVARGWA